MVVVDDQKVSQFAKKELGELKVWDSFIDYCIPQTTNFLAIFVFYKFFFCHVFVS